MFTSFQTRYGIKMALAGFLAFYTSLILDLNSVTWSIMTVMVLMLAQFVGAIVEKSAFRILGTIAGGGIAIWLVGNHVQNAFFFLPALFVVLAFFTFKFGSVRAPYAYFLCAMTTAIVVSATVTQPKNVFDVALTRVLEISIGIVASLLVTLLVWPRHATKEFQENLLKALVKLRTYLIHRARLALDMPEDGDKDSETFQMDFIGDFTRLRQLLHFAARESATFRKEAPAYRIALTMINALQACGISLNKPDRRTADPDAQTPLFVQLRPEFRKLVDALDAEFDAIIREARGEQVEASNVQSAFDAFQEQLKSLRSSGRTLLLPEEDFQEAGQFFLGLEEIRRRLNLLRQYFVAAKDEKPVGEAGREDVPVPPLHWWEDPVTIYWIRNGIKGAVGLIAALLCIQWLEPPGKALMPLAAWLFIVLSRGLVHSQGDQRAFHYTARWAVGGIVYVFLAAISWPFLTSFFGVSLFLVTALFIFGYTTALVPGVTIGMQFWILLLTGTIGLNPQTPVAFSSILDVYFGILLGMLIGAIVQRLLWPVLPQKELRNALAEFFALLTTAFDSHRLLFPEGTRTRLALIPNEVRTWMQSVRLPRRFQSVHDEFHSLVLDIQELNLAIQSLQRARREKESTTAEKELTEVIGGLEEWMKSAFSRLSDAFKAGQWSAPLPSPHDLLDCLERKIREIREQRHLHAATVSELVYFFALTERYRLASRSVEAIQARMGRLHLQAWSRDTVL